jgi:branched-subunit amino acid aminotransferase/4-amino-4-deoxychorismate lyase
MHQFVSFNRQILRAENASISAAASAALYGKGVFTTIAIGDAQPFLWEKHWRRLTANAAVLQINLSEFDEKTTQTALAELITKNKFTKGRARITFFDESSSNIWNFEAAERTSFLITTADLKPMPEKLRLTVSPFRINSASPLAGVKSCNYLEKISALSEAKKRGFDEAVQLNERGGIASACMANIFWLAKGKLFTPPLAGGCLAGTTREFLLERLIKSEKLECFEAESDLQSLRNADAIFLTSAGLNVIQVAEFDGRIYAGKYADITNIIDLI